MDNERLEEIARQTGMTLDQVRLTQLDDEHHPGKQIVKKHKWRKRALRAAGVLSGLAIITNTLPIVNAFGGMKSTSRTSQYFPLVGVWSSYDPEKTINFDYFFINNIIQMGITVQTAETRGPYIELNFKKSIVTSRGFDYYTTENVENNNITIP